MVLLASYIAVLVGLVLYERAAHQILDRAADLQRQQKYGAASVAYKLVIERYPLSIAVPRARSGLAAIGPAAEQLGVAGRLRQTLPESLLSDRMDPYVVDQLPLVVWPCCATVLFLVFVSRLPRRRGWALLALLLAAASALGSALLLGMSGFVPISWAASIIAALKPSLVDPAPEYAATWIVVAITALLTLSPTSRRLRRFATNKQIGKELCTGAPGETASSRV